ncbi:branched-chain amino acid ABC transporter permease [Agrobacterium salinitolerans]|uniref:branched-chain amino acid ABC transporter permease n=1 Tax=Agrobacterium salinitolerans TaxID=1183413 RepID=UPI0022B809F5|nr:branched-chain amino acid ABC transporter permease [Agrobacterium salinitolerans]MCZ7976958.1 branched-chain amino acid ABC transporter permease [Agrobacterium salinitolerans]
MTNQILQGILLGGYYALIACGLSFMFSVMRIINLAHGSLAVAAAYLIFVLTERTHLPLWASFLISVAVMAVVGWLIQRLILDRCARGGQLLPILSTFGLSMVIDNTLFEQFGADTRSLANSIGDLSWDSWELPGGLYVGKLPVLIFVTAVALLATLQIMLTYTKLGRAIRATAEDPETAGLVGIDARRVNATAAAITLVTVTIAGMFLAMRATFEPYSGAPQLLFAFEAAVIGGAGSLWGTLAGGIILGIAQTFGASLHPLGFLIAGHAVFLIIVFTRLIFPDLLSLPAHLLARRTAQGGTA